MAAPSIDILRIPAPVLTALTALPTHRPVSPADRILAGHANGLSHRELLATLLGRTDAAGLALAGRLLDDRGLTRLVACRAADILALGVPTAAAVNLLAAHELAARLAAEDPPLDPSQRQDPDRLARRLVLQHARAGQEVLGAVYLDDHDQPLTCDTFFVGTRDQVRVDPRPFLKQAILLPTPRLIAFHIHPTARRLPSAEDVLFARRLRNACAVIGVELLDHLVLSHDRRWTSLRQHRSWT
jgi:DNA repair protein RadC